jgi:hypothetical protein
MELLIGAGGGALLLAALVAIANRRRRGGPDHASGRSSPGAPAHGSSSTNTWPLGGSGSV